MELRVLQQNERPEKFYLLDARAWEGHPSF